MPNNRVIDFINIVKCMRWTFTQQGCDINPSPFIAKNYQSFILRFELLMDIGILMRLLVYF